LWCRQVGGPGKSAEGMGLGRPKKGKKPPRQHKSKKKKIPHIKRHCSLCSQGKRSIKNLGETKHVQTAQGGVGQKKKTEWSCKGKRWDKGGKRGMRGGWGPLEAKEPAGLKNERPVWCLGVLGYNDGVRRGGGGRG